eukprot:8650459-Karenia_brevis.AAC.1
MARGLSSRVVSKGRDMCPHVPFLMVKTLVIKRSEKRTIIGTTLLMKGAGTGATPFHLWGRP